ncbi:unnamed protein product [Protopolystoma xenopodis]|uniref:Uncharacterized protein n=1 Tax=Protopolystoma xenopodis TaxID=117903 RepID=A0A3S5BSY8_9PLAT|nr:unnamed protein product [Protopolystoma xenopodis]
MLPQSLHLKAEGGVKDKSWKDQVSIKFTPWDACVKCSSSWRPDQGVEEVHVHTPDTDLIDSGEKAQIERRRPFQSVLRGTGETQ